MTEQALITRLSRHLSHVSSCTDHVTEHELITWLRGTDHVAESLITWLRGTDHVAESH